MREHARLTTPVARMYDEQGIGQVRIAEPLALSQARVSRLLKQAEAMGIVRITVSKGPGHLVRDRVTWSGGQGNWSCNGYCGGDLALG